MKRILVLLTMISVNTLAFGGGSNCPAGSETDYECYKDKTSGALQPHVNATMRGYVDAPRWNPRSVRTYKWWSRNNSLTSFKGDWVEQAALSRRLTPNDLKGVPPLFTVSKVEPYNTGYSCTDWTDGNHSVCHSYYQSEWVDENKNGNPDYIPGAVLSPIGRTVNVARLYPPKMSTRQVSSFESVLSMITRYDRRVAFIPLIIHDWPTDSPHYLAGDSAHITITENKNGTLKRFFYLPRVLLELGRLNKQYKSTDGKWYSMTLTRVLLHEVIHELLHYSDEKTVKSLLFSESKIFTYQQEQEVVSLVNMLLAGPNGVYGEVEAERGVFSQTRTVLPGGKFKYHDDLENGH